MQLFKYEEQRLALAQELAGTRATQMDVDRYFLTEAILDEIANELIKLASGEERN